MIGIIEKVMVDCLFEVGDDELRQDVFFKAGIPADRVYRIDRHYPDEETERLVSAVLEVTGLDPDELYRVFSTVFFDLVEYLFPQFMRMSETSEDLVRKQATIHALIAAGSQTRDAAESSSDKFQIEDLGPHQLTVRYQSRLQLCGLYEALVRAAADRFGDSVEFSAHDCAHHGADACTMTVRWTSIAGRPTHFAGSVDQSATTRAGHG